MEGTMLGETTNAATKDALCFSFEAAPCLLTRSCPIIRMIRQGRGMGQERAAKRLCRRAVKADRKAHQFLGPTEYEDSLTEEDEDIMDLIPSLPKNEDPDSIGVKLHINVAPVDCDDHDRILPLISLGNVYLLTKPGARLASLPDSTLPEHFDQEGATIWGPESMLGGKLVFWACKQAAYEARQAVARHWQRWQGNKRHSARAESPQYRSLMDELLSSTGMDLQHELEFQEERHKIMAYANADWKVCKLPSLPKTGRFAWPWRRKRGGREKPAVPWRHALLEQKFRALSSAAYLVQVPLFHAITYMQNHFKDGQQQNFTLASKLCEVLSPKPKKFTRRKSREGAQLPFYTIPGIWMLMPSSKGWVKFSPYFLSQEELQKAWMLWQQFHVKSALQSRKKARQRDLMNLRQALGKWAVKQTGITSTEEAPPDAPPSSEYEPKELKELLREMGVQQNPSQPRNRIKFKLGPYNLLVIVACGAALTAAELKAKAAATMDSLAHNTGIGRMLTRKRTIPPEVHALPATELLEQNRLHNAAVLARAYPEEVPAVHQSKGQDRASAVQSLAAVSPFMPEQMLQEFKSLFEESSASEEEADQQVSSSERKSSTVSAQEGTGPQAGASKAEEVIAQPNAEPVVDTSGATVGGPSSTQNPDSKLDEELADVDSRLDIKVKNEVLGMTKDMMELYTVMSSIALDDSLSMFTNTGIGSSKKPLEESHITFVPDLSKTTAAVGLSILKSAVRTLANGMEVTPIGQNFRLIDGRQGRRRWLLQIPKTTPISTTRQSLQDSESNVPPELTGEKSAEATDQVDASPDGQNTTRCSYVIANVDMDQAASKNSKGQRGFKIATGSQVAAGGSVSDDVGSATDDFLKGVVLVGDLQIQPHLLPEELVVGINNASHFGEELKEWP